MQQISKGYLHSASHEWLTRYVSVATVGEGEGSVDIILSGICVGWLMPPALQLSLVVDCIVLSVVTHCTLQFWWIN